VDPTLFNVWFNLANAQLTLGRREDAAESLRRTLHINPNVTAARCVCAHCVGACACVLSI
jgi:tetratricopeptide (TPR) repeat protein